MSGLLKKKELVTLIAPIPGFIPRQLAIDILHSHGEVITLNPLVLEYKPIKAPRDAASDEFYSTWYEITERIQYVPGLGKMGSGKLSFNACFHDMPWGLQAHIYAPMSTDMRYKYRLGGNQPGVEPPEPLEMGLAALGAPSDGLYIRTDVEVKCSVAVMGFVKSQLKAASKLMVERIIKKAELVDSGALQAMIENGKLKTINPADRSNTLAATPTSTPSPGATPALHDQELKRHQSQHIPPQSLPAVPGSPPPIPYQVPRPQSIQSPYGFRPGSGGIPQYQHPASPGLGVYPGYPGFQNGGYPAHPGHASYGGYPGVYPQQFHPAHYAQYGQQAPQELQAHSVHPSAAPTAHTSAIEMPGDFYHPQTLMQPPPHPSSAAATPQSNRDSATLSTGQWSAATEQTQATSMQGSPALPGSRPDSIASNGSAGVAGGYRSPGLDKSFSSELSTHSETQEEHRADALKKLDPTSAQGQEQGGYVYNPADFAR